EAGIGAAAAALHFAALKREIAFVRARVTVDDLEARPKQGVEHVWIDVRIRDHAAPGHDDFALLRVVHASDAGRGPRVGDVVGGRRAPDPAQLARIILRALSAELLKERGALVDAGDDR